MPEYLLSTALGLLPEAALMCYFGSTAQNLQHLREDPRASSAWDTKHLAFMSVGIVCAALLLCALIRTGRDALQEVDRYERYLSAQAVDISLQLTLAEQTQGRQSQRRDFCVGFVVL